VFPIHLSDEIVPAAVFYASVTPVIAWFFIKKTVMDPMEAERKSIEVERTKRQNEQRLSAKRQEASAAVHLMQATYNRIMTEELARTGLVVTRAVYGCTAEGSTQFRPDQSLDVTVPIQCMVKDGTLHLHDSSKVCPLYCLQFSPDLIRFPIYCRATCPAFMIRASGMTRFCA